MIAYLKGTLIEARPTQIIVDVQGVGYDLLIPVSSFDRLPARGGEIRILTHLAIREDAHTLFGFMTEAERDLFRKLVHTVSGIGPKIALNVLSGMSVEAFSAAVAGGDVRALSQISGVGKKTAERIVVELKDKVTGGGSLPLRLLKGLKPVLADAVQALVALGLKPGDAEDSVARAAQKLGPEARVEDLVRHCLKK